jgi:class 3 adenylate cyclase
MADEDLTSTTAPGHPPGKGGEMLAAAHATEVKLVLPFGILALGCAVASMAICFGNELLFVLGIELPIINPHVQAVVMWSLSLVAVYALWQDRKHHGSNVPLVLGAFGTAVLIATLYVRYFVEIEVFAYVLLVIAAFANQNVFLGVLNRTVRDQAHEIEIFNQGLEVKVEQQVQEIDRLARLKQFLSPQVADLVVSEGKDKLLETHRRYIACLFCDIRDFTAVSEDIEPEEVIAILQAYHERIGNLVAQHHGTIGYRAGDGLMVFFNDPIPCEEPVLDAVKLALKVRDAFEAIREPWSKRGHAIGLGLGVASGYATLGLVGFQGRTDYTAIGGAVNIASRLCDKAEDGQILLTQRAYLDVERRVQAKLLGPLDLKGVKHATEVYNILGMKESVA